MAPTNRAGELYAEQLKALRGNLEAAVMEWVCKHALTAVIGDVVALSDTVKSIACGHARDIMELGVNAKIINEQPDDKAA